MHVIGTHVVTVFVTQKNVCDMNEIFKMLVVFAQQCTKIYLIGKERKDIENTGHKSFHNNTVGVILLVSFW